jgi:hypothetical protein
MGYIKITLAISSKVDGSNQAQIILNISPKLRISSLANFVDSLNFSSNTKSSLVDWQIIDSKVYLLVDYD